MADIVKRTGIGALLLLIIPCFVWLLGWRWQPDGGGTLLHALFWLTETVTSPWGVATSVLLSGWFLWCLRFRLRPALLLLAIIISATLVGQYSKSAIKQQVQEPRPYVLWLERTYGLDDKAFYALNRAERSAEVRRVLENDTRLPAWLKQHWAFETGFAFPSGHTMFAAIWALLSIGLLWPRRHYKTVIILMLWAAGVLTSRLLLGMHWPRDLLVSTLISWLLVVLASWSVQRWCGPLSIPPQEKCEIARRDADN